VIRDLKDGDRIELSPACLKLTSDVCSLVNLGPSASLLIDYGDSRAFSDSIRVWDI
jgi:SAM-dependent MidA family methyltransferase